MKKILIALPEDLKNKLKVIAEKNRRSVVKTVEIAIIEYIKRQTK